MKEILGSLLAGLLMLATSVLFSNYQKQSALNQQVAATAQQAVKFNTAVQSYITQYSSAVSAAATPTTPAVITVAMLQAPTVSLLPVSFSATNPFSQTWQAQVLQPTAGNLQVLALALGGTALSDEKASRVAALIGAAGGFIPLNDSGTWPTGSSVAQGAYAGWTQSTSGFTGIAGGNLASLLTFSNGQFVSNYLYRNNVGNTSLNTMNTPLIMASTQTIGGACTPNGAIAQDGTGLILSCQSGVWKSSLSKGLGLSGETWHNPSRSVNTNYVNNHLFPIMVSYSFPDTGAQNPVSAVYVDGVALSALNFDSGTYFGTTQGSFIVPPGSSYQIYNSIGQQTNVWAELY